MNLLMPRLTPFQPDAAALGAAKTPGASRTVDDKAETPAGSGANLPFSEIFAIMARPPQVEEAPETTAAAAEANTGQSANQVGLPEGELLALVFSNTSAGSPAGELANREMKPQQPDPESVRHLPPDVFRFSESSAPPLVSPAELANLAMMAKNHSDAHGDGKVESLKNDPALHTAIRRSLSQWLVSAAGETAPAKVDVSGRAELSPILLALSDAPGREEAQLLPALLLDEPGGKAFALIPEDADKVAIRLIGNAVRARHGRHFVPAYLQTGNNDGLLPESLNAKSMETPQQAADGSGHEAPQADGNNGNGGGSLNMALRNARLQSNLRQNIFDSFGPVAAHAEQIGYSAAGLQQLQTKLAVQVLEIQQAKIEGRNGQRYASAQSLGEMPLARTMNSGDLAAFSRLMEAWRQKLQHTLRALQQPDKADAAPVPRAAEMPGVGEPASAGAQSGAVENVVQAPGGPGEQGASELTAQTSAHGTTEEPGRAGGASAHGAESAKQPGQFRTSAVIVRASGETAPTHSAEHVERLVSMRRTFENLRAQILNKIRDTATNVRIQLRPERFGRMQVRFGMREGGLQASFLVQNAEVKTILDSGLEALKQALHEKGMRVEALEVRVMTAQAPPQRQEPAYQGNQEDAPRQKSRGEEDRQRDHKNRHRDDDAPARFEDYL